MDHRQSYVNLNYAMMSMLHRARTYRRDVVPGRWVIVTSHRRKPWEVIVEPDTAAALLVVITAYPHEEL
jgi:hypothetical protein